MGLVHNDDRPQLNHTRTKSVTKLFDELLQNGSSSSSGSTIKTRDKSKSPPFGNEAPLPFNPPPMESFASLSGSKHSSNILTQRILEGLQSQYHPPPQPHESSPTDSHPRPHPRSRSRSRHRSSRSSETISALLLLATERLSQETSRANEAERQASEVLAHFKIAHQAKQRLEIDLQRVKDELGLYKTQLDIAQAEIRRAQEIVNKVDQQRAEAEDEARRGREKIRKLTEARSIELAMEEGRRLGYEEGVRQGRLMAQARDTTDVINQPIRYYRRTSFRSARDDDIDDQTSYFSYTQEERRSSESFHSPSTSVRSSSRRRRTSGARHSAPPISPNSTPRPNSKNRIPSSASNPDNNANRPEDITVQPHPQPRKDSNPTRPIPIRNHSPTISQRSFKLPDGYIPTLDANSAISLPPPHGLSTPVPLNNGASASATSDSKQAAKKASTSRSSEYAENRNRIPKSADGDSSTTLSRQRHINKRNSRPPHTGPESEASGRLSTHISESSLLGRPDDIIGRNENREDDSVDYFNFNQGTTTIRSESRESTSQPERIAAKWRCVNPDIRSPSPGQSTFLDGYNGLTARMQGKFVIERPSSAGPSQRSRPSPRRPREIVLPSPLTRTIQLNPNNNNNNNSNIPNPNRTAQETADQSKRPREIVLPSPKIGTTTTSLQPSNHNQHLPDRAAARETVNHQNDRQSPPSSSLSPGDYRDNTRPNFLSRSTSNMTVPGIEIETPSSHTLSTLSGRTILDPVLLTPESANRPTPLPSSSQISQPTPPPNSSLGLYFNNNNHHHQPNDEQRITMILPDNNLPHGFIPLSPIPGMTNLDSYPSGFAPSVPKLQDEYPGGQLPSNFSYPSSPIVRSGV